MMWDMLRGALQESLPESEYNLWIKPLICQHQDDQIIELAGPDRFFCSWVRDRYLDLIKDKLKSLNSNGGREVKLTVAGPRLIESPKSGQLRLPGVRNQQSQLRSLHPGYTFDQFMVGQSNVLARSACHALANNESAVRELGDEILKKIAHELTEKLRASTTVDWQVRDSVRAKIRNMVRRLLKKYKYPPDKRDDAIDLVLQQAEKLSYSWTQ